MFGAPAGLVSGPRMLKMVRTPEFAPHRRDMPHRRVMDRREHEAEAGLGQAARDRFGWQFDRRAQASSTSALPELEDTLRLPCLATLAPAAAQTNIAAVEMLKVFAPSPPVPTMSTKWLLSGTSTLAENSRITLAAAAISPMVSFFTAQSGQQRGTSSPARRRRA
jgi:hypothetical protein